MGPAGPSGRREPQACRAAPPARPVSPADRERIIATLKGIGPIADRLIAEQREIAGFRASS